MTGPEQTDTSSQTSFSASPSAQSAPLELMQKRWFCMGLEHSGKTFKHEAESSATLLEKINQSMVTWVDYITDNPMKDLPAVAAQMGFSESFISSTVLL